MSEAEGESMKKSDIRFAGVDRRAFLTGALAFGAARPFRAAAGLFSSGTPNMTLGILTDVHIHMSKTKDGFKLHAVDTLKRTFEWFRDQGVDGISISGDMADLGFVEELNAIGRCWFDVFPDNKAPDGRHVEKLFVYGNHDWEGYKYGRAAKRYFGEKGYDHAIHKDPAAAWKNAFREEYAPVWRKEVKGYTFIGAHWTVGGCRGREETGARQAAPWFEANGSTIDPSKPFFYLQHPPLKNTCHCDWVWGQDTGEMTEILSRYPNAIALSGHSHASVNDERAIWQGDFTSIGCGSLSYVGMTYGDVGRENDSAGMAFAAENPHKTTRRPGTSDGKQGLIARLYDDRIVIQRRDFVSMAAIGDDWVIPLPSKKPMPFAFAPRARESVAPQFEKGAALAAGYDRAKNRGNKNVKPEMQDVVRLTIPSACRAGEARAFDFEITFEGTDGTRDVRYAFASGFYRAETSKEAKVSTTCTIPLRRLKATGDLRISVRPRNSFGKAGEAICVNLAAKRIG